MPGGVTPPIATLPPTGITPGVPGGVTPPIATLPPTGITPGVPGGVTPPIATLPPPTGITPGMPGGVTPPIATLPPSGITPGVPGGVTPPIATLPPPTGITPGVPGGVTPPIATLPPTGITPGVPGGVTPPIAGLPPRVVADCSEQPLPDDTRQRIDSNGILCADSYRPESNAAAGVVVNQAPITPNRQFEIEPEWNVWTDSGYTNNADGRFGIRRNGDSSYVTFGADRQITDRLIAGASLTLQRSHTDGFSHNWTLDTDGIVAGPYVGFRLSSAWTLDGSVSFGWLDNDQHLATFAGSYGSMQYSTSESVTGQYAWHNTVFRPGFDVLYSYTQNGAHDFGGTIHGLTETFNAAANSSGYGTIGFSTEINHAFRTGETTTLVPYFEPLVSYEYLRPGGGLMITSTLSRRAPSPWSGAGTIGLRALISRSLFIGASFGYQSFGQPNLNTLGPQLHVSYAF